MFRKILLILLFLGSSNIWASQKFVVISDLNGSYGSLNYDPIVKSAINEIIKMRPEAVLITGDMVAGQKSGLNYEQMWKSFHEVVSDELAKVGIPLVVTPGNHDASIFSRFAGEREIFSLQWIQRTPMIHFIDQKNYPFFYAASFSQTLLISLDATAPGKLHPEQLQWLENLLETHSKKFKTIIVQGHLPTFSFAQGRELETLDSSLNEIFERYGVDIYLSGHHHAFYPGLQNSVHYVSQACLGSGARRLIGEVNRSQKLMTLIEIEGDSISINGVSPYNYNDIFDKKTLPQSLEFEGMKIFLDL